MQRSRITSALRISLLYAVITGLWVVISDRVLGILIADPGQMAWLQTVKGLGFIFVSTLVLYLFLHHALRAREQAEARHHTSETWLSTILSITADAIITVDETQQITLFNQGAERIFGYRPEAILGQSIDQLLAPATASAYHQHVDGLMYVIDQDQQMDTHLHILAQRSDGTTFPAEVSVAPLRAHKQTPLVIILRDISEHQQTAAELHKANRNLRTLIEINQALAHATQETELLRDTCRILVNFGEYRLAWVGFVEQDNLQYICHLAQASSADHTDISTELIQEPVVPGSEAINSALRTGTPTVIQHMLTDPATSRWHAEVARHGFASAIVLPLNDDTQSFGVLVIYAADPEAFELAEVKLLTELANDLAFGIRALRARAQHERAERALLEREVRLRTLFDETLNPIMVVNEAGQYLDANEAALAFLECDRTELLRKDVWDFAVPDTLEQQQQEHTPFVRRRTIETTYTIHGRIKTLLLNIVPVSVAGQTILYGIGQDITDRKQAEEKLKKERDFISAVVDTSGVLVLVLNMQGQIVRFNPACEHVTGYSFAEVQDQPFWDIFIAPEEVASVKAMFAGMQKGEAPTEYESSWRTRDGEQRMIAWSNAVLRNDVGAIEYIVSTGIDITVRQWWEQELRQRNWELTTLNTVTAAVSGSLEITEVFGILSTLLAGQLNVAGGALFYYDPGDDQLSLEASWELPQRAVDAFKTLPAHSSYNERVVRRKEISIQPDFREVDLFLAVGLDADRPRWQSYMGIPLVARGEIQGVVDLFSHAPTLFREDQTDFFTVLGQQVGVAIQNARLFAQVRTGRARLQLLSQRLLDTQEIERRNIARELHDEIGQALTAMKINLHAVQRLADAATLEPYLEENISIVDRTLQQVRNLSLDLRPSMLDDLGLVSALRWYVDRQARLAGFEARFTANLGDARLPPDLETVCFRVTQEALTNVVRHAHAGKVNVSLRQRDDTLFLIIRDDGVGFDVRQKQARAMQGASSGLLGMQERVLFAGGHMEITSRPQRGTEIWVRFPLATWISSVDLDERSSAR